MSTFPDIDLVHPDETSQAEADAFNAPLLRIGVTGYPLTVFAVWAQHDPSVIKRYLLQMDATMPDAQAACLANVATLHHYATMRFGSGVKWELETALAGGFTREEALEILALAWLTDGPNTQFAVHEGASDLLRMWPAEPPGRPPFPAGWAPDPDAFRSGIEPTSPPDMTDREHELLRDWYVRTIGEVPPAIAFLAAHHPSLLKTWRLRWENTIRVLPKQVMPFVMLHSAANRGDVPGARTAALLARAWGLTRHQAVAAATIGLSFGRGLEPLGAIGPVLDDLLADWPETTN